MMAILTAVRWYLKVFWICISLMASDAEHLSICLWALCMSSLEKCLSRSFPHLLIGLFLFLELSHLSSLCILEIKLLSEVSLTNIFSHMFGSLFIFLMFSLAMHKVFFFFDVVLFVYCMGYLKFSCLCSPLGLLWCHDLYLTLSSILSLFFCMV